MLFILEHNTSMMGSMKNIIDKKFENSQKHFDQNLSVSVYQNDITQAATYDMNKDNHKIELATKTAQYCINSYQIYTM